MNIVVKKITSQPELEQAFAIRRKVFVEEQKVDAREEYDQFESIAVHFLAKAGNEPAGTARWRVTEKGIKLERFAVLPNFRSAGVGSALVQAVLKDLPESDQQIYLNGQVTAIPFYTRFGFRQTGAQFTEAGIEHFKMILDKREEDIWLEKQA